MRQKRGQRKNLSTLEKGLKILMLFNEERPVLDIATISAELGLPRSTAYRYVATLEAHGLLEKDTKPRHYQLGLKVLELSWVVRQQLSILTVARPIMQELQEKTQESVFLFAVHGRRAICLERIESPHSLRLTFERGKTLSLHAGASAKVLLAHLNEQEQDQILQEANLPRYTEHTITDPKVLKAELRKIRQQGYALSYGEVDPISCAIGAPILDEQGNLVAGLSVAGPKYRFEEKISKFVPVVVEAAHRIAQQLIRAG
jgi:DNA-binding IclR family transcriptional regulator